MLYLMREQGASVTERMLLTTLCLNLSHFFFCLFAIIATLVYFSILNTSYLFYKKPIYYTIIYSEFQEIFKIPSQIPCFFTKNHTESGFCFIFLKIKAKKTALKADLASNAPCYNSTFTPSEKHITKTEMTLDRTLQKHTTKGHFCSLLISNILCNPLFLRFCASPYRPSVKNRYRFLRG